MRKINNFFIKTSENVTANFTSTTKKIVLSTAVSIIAGQYIKIDGSILNDGVYKVAAVSDTEITVEESLSDEIADVILSGLAPTKDFLSIVARIQSDVSSEKYSDVAEIKRGDTTIKYVGGSNSSWEEDYKKVLTPYAKLKAV